MIRRIFTAMFVVAIALSFTVVASAQEKQDVKDKAVQEKAMQEKADQMHMEHMKTVSCDPTCGFRVTSHDEAELVDIVKTHAKKKHAKEMSEADVKGMMKSPGEMREKRMEMKKKEDVKKKDDGMR